MSQTDAKTLLLLKARGMDTVNRKKTEHTNLTENFLSFAMVYSKLFHAEPFRFYKCLKKVKFLLSLEGRDNVSYKFTS